MTDQVINLLSRIVTSEVDRKMWMTGLNYAFNMSPLKMIEVGREQEVIDYLNYHIEGR